MLLRHYFSSLTIIFSMPFAASAQLTFTNDFNGPSGSGGSTANPAFYTTDFRDAVLRAESYLSTQFDVRGTLTVRFGTKTNVQVGSGTLATGGTSYYFQNGGFSSGISYEQATTNSSGQTNQSNLDFNSSQASWYTTQALPVTAGFNDVQSVATHEITHSLGFTSLIKSTGAGLQNLALGQPDTYSRLDSFLRVGTGTNAPSLITSDGRFNTAQVTVADLTGGNIYFHGEMAMAANGGQPVRMSTNSLSHIGDLSSAVMFPSITTGTAKRAFQNAEMAMLIDIGWNQFIWKNSTGTWGQNATTLTSPMWQNLDGDNMLSPVGTITPNLVLKFGGTGGYTSTNDLLLTTTGGRFLANRMILNSTGGTSTLAASGGNVLRFDTTLGITPLVRQDGAGAFNISHPVELTNSNLQLGGDGAGQSTLSGAISVLTGNTGGITKLGTGTFVISGNNNYNGLTTINSGTLIAANSTGSALGTGNAVVNSGGTLGGTGAFTGSVSVANGGTITAGASTGGDRSLDTGPLTLQGRYRVTIFGLTNTDASRLNVSGAIDLSSVNDSLLIELNGPTVATLRASGPHTYTVASSTGLLGTINTSDFTTVGFQAGEWSISYPSNSIVLNFTPVPEPASIIVFAAASLGVFRSWPLRRRGEKGQSIPIISA